jgi:RimJ/RimL family protein N-acetyltransferase
MIEFDGYRPGALADIVGLHARYYARHWNFGLAFEAKVATELAEFLSRMDGARDVFLAAYSQGMVVGSIAIDVSGGGPKGAHLRWFIVGEPGKGLGKTLLDRGIAHCDRLGVPSIWLTTFAGLDIARALYDRHGFALAGERDQDQWQGGVREQVFVRPSPSPAA